MPFGISTGTLRCELAAVLHQSPNICVCLQRVMDASLQTYGRAGDALIVGVVTAEISRQVPWKKKI